MANRLTHIVDAIRTKDYAIATESIAQVLQQKVEQSLAQERQRLASTLVREEVLTEMPALYDAQDDEEAFFINARSFGGPERYYTFARLKAAGIPQEAMRACYSRYENLQAFAIKKKYAKKAAKVLNLESVTNPALAKFNEDSKSISMKCQECGKTFKSASLDPKCPKCGGYDIDLSEQTKDETKCKKCGTVSKFGYDGWCKKCWDKDDTDYKEVHVREGVRPGHVSTQGWPDKKTAEYWAEKTRKYDEREITVVPPAKGEKWWRIHYGPELDEAVVEKKEKLLCHDCGNVWMGSFPAKCPECGCRKCVRTDEPLSEGHEERIVRHTCKGCGNYWMGPAYEDECPKCFKRQFGEGCGKLHEGKCSQCGTDRNPVDALLGDVCGKCARDNHKKATGKK